MTPEKKPDSGTPEKKLDLDIFSLLPTSEHAELPEFHYSGWFDDSSLNQPTEEEAHGLPNLARLISADWNVEEESFVPRLLY